MLNILIQIITLNIHVSQLFKVLFIIILQPTSISFQIITKKILPAFFSLNYECWKLLSHNFDNKAAYDEECKYWTRLPPASCHPYAMRKVFSKACSQIPQTQDIWLEKDIHA